MPGLSTAARSLAPGGVFAAMEYLTLASATCAPPIRGFVGPSAAAEREAERTFQAVARRFAELDARRRVEPGAEQFS